MEVPSNSANDPITECYDFEIDAYTSKLELRGAIEHALCLLVENNLVSTEKPSTITLNMKKMGEKIYQQIVEMSSEYTFVSDEELVHINKEDEENEFNEVEENNSEEENYEPPEKSRKDYEIVSFKTKLRVVTLARQNPKWKLKTLQNKGTQRLKSKSELNRWSYANVLNIGPQSSPRPVTKPQTSQQPASRPHTSPQPAPRPQASQWQPATPQTSQGQSLPFIQDLSNNCCYCRQRHYLAFCPQFSSLSRKDRVEVVVEAQLSFNCLGRQNVRQCRSTRRCNICGAQNHTLIYQEHRTSSTKPKASQVRSRSSITISNTTMSSQRLPLSSSTPSLSDAPSHQPARQKSSQKRSSHKQPSHSRSFSSSTPASSPTPSSHKKSSPPSSSRVSRTSHYPRSHLKSILKSSISSSSSKSSQKVKRVRSSSPISNCDRSSQSSLSSCSRAPVLLATCKAFAISSKRVPTLIRLLIDPGSELTLASAKLVAKLNLKRHPGSIPIQGVGSKSPGATQGQVSLILQSTYSSSQVNLKALILPKITSQVLSSIISEQDWPRLRSLRGHSEPISFNTRFSWAVLDATSSPNQGKSLSETLTKFRVQEEVLSSPTPFLSFA
ncbi:hypothetical protein M0802_013407 [Mischocyttarus mexicanus]|nr:hypothetical protein M0802_013407 [Mischocyttarus mexicanus]